MNRHLISAALDHMGYNMNHNVFETMLEALGNRAFFAVTRIADLTTLEISDAVESAVSEVVDLDMKAAP